MSLTSLKKSVTPEETIAGNQLSSAKKRSRLIIDRDFSKELPRETVRSYLTKIPLESEEKYVNSDITKETHIVPEKGIEFITIIETKPYKPDYFLSLQKWEGNVIEVMKDYFLAKLVDLTAPGADEQAEIPLEEVSIEDLDLVVPGAIFYWNIGYEDESNGQRKRTSIIRFRRLPAWSQSEIKEAKKEAEEIGKSLKWE
ncbi:MAG: hypothetical protein L0Y68_04175 [Candidatus Dadabacteria bacterium]|nr:hypothetical protein [Candidatus Dadabacteria bacterium]